ncbi:MAG TPA: RluA family pseudouridine synthase [Pyrinomonadaceae bacterium]|nr:RluA family pseudouridine synthase [Pyrinomonadaceae bacterium]
MTRFELQVAAEDAKKRLDEFLFAKIPKVSKIYLREVIKEGKCEVNGEWQNRGYILRKNDFVEAELELGERKIVEPEPIALDIIFEDRELLVVNKPAGMLVHPTVKVRGGTLLNALAYYLNYEEEKRRGGEEEKIHSREVSSSPHLPFSSSNFIRAGLVHRLDKDTSGLLVIAKNPRSHRILCDHFKRKLVEKRYFALVGGVFEDDEGTIDTPVGRYAEERFWNIKADGKAAETRFWVKERFSDSTLLELEPVTGRTNQLRIHLASIGHAIIGDKKYGGREFRRLCLHAYRLSFWHPNGNQWMEFENIIGNFES